MCAFDQLVRLKLGAAAARREAAYLSTQPLAKPLQALLLVQRSVSDCTDPAEDTEPERPGTGKVPVQQEDPGSMQVVLSSWFEKKEQISVCLGKEQRKCLFKNQAVVLLKNP